MPPWPEIRRLRAQLRRISSLSGTRLPARPRRRRPDRSGPRRNWAPTTTTTLIAALPGLAALIALLFNYQSIKATDDQLQLAQQGQVTSDYNAAVVDLASPSLYVRLGGIYALQRLMSESPHDQATIISVLCAFDRGQPESGSTTQASSASLLPTDAEAALTVVGTRDAADDGNATVIDLDQAVLPVLGRPDEYRSHQG
jgi:hypothetical protein